MLAYLYIKTKFRNLLLSKVSKLKQFKTVYFEGTGNAQTNFRVLELVPDALQWSW